MNTITTFPMQSVDDLTFEYVAAAPRVLAGFFPLSFAGGEIASVIIDGEDQLFESVSVLAYNCRLIEFSTCGTTFRVRFHHPRTRCAIGFYPPPPKSPCSP